MQDIPVETLVDEFLAADTVVVVEGQILGSGHAYCNEIGRFCVSE